jgi:hypothetical protein
MPWIDVVPGSDGWLDRRLAVLQVVGHQLVICYG